MWEEESEEIDSEDRLNGNEAWELGFEQGERAASEEEFEDDWE